MSGESRYRQKKQFKLGAEMKVRLRCGRQKRLELAAKQDRGRILD